jgi:hypothetical protein
MHQIWEVCSQMLISGRFSNFGPPEPVAAAPDGLYNPGQAITPR